MFYEIEVINNETHSKMQDKIIIIQLPGAYLEIKNNSKKSQNWKKEGNCVKRENYVLFTMSHVVRTQEKRNTAELSKQEWNL